MTAESLVKAREAKAAKAIERMEQARNDITVFRAWLVTEREAFEHRMKLADTKGRDDMEFIIADICWRDVINNKPEAPPDWMWRVIRGEAAQEDDTE